MRDAFIRLGEQAQIIEVGTPRTYERYTHRYRGAVGGIRLNLRNSNQWAVPYDIGVPGFWQAGDTTWPGLGTVAGVLSSRHVADAVYSFYACDKRSQSLVWRAVKKSCC
jgi:phytoene dehydrogenase-like protein